MDGFKVDASELMQFAADLGEVSETAGGFVRSAVEVTARNIKDEAVSTVRSRKQLGHASAAIGYDVRSVHMFGISQVDAEIGYEKDHNVGALGNLIEYGAPGASNALAPTSDLKRALDANQKDFAHGLDKALKDAEAVLRG